jgi:hypothetical protein
MADDTPPADVLLSVFDALAVACERPASQRPDPLDDETLDTIEREGNRPWLTELVRVYRLAKLRDESDDVGPFDFFFR